MILGCDDLLDERGNMVLSSSRRRLSRPSGPELTLGTVLLGAALPRLFAEYVIARQG